MFFRTKVIKNTPLVQLVESYRDAEGRPRQRIVASLGQEEIPASSQRTVARGVKARLQGQKELFSDEYSRDEAEWIDRIVRLAERTQSAQAKRENEPLDGVLAEEVQTENVVVFGPELAGMTAWDALDLTNKLLSWGMKRRTVALAGAMVVNRLIEPLSEWALIDWLKGSALPECLNVRVRKSTKDRLYRTSDELLRMKEKLETHLRGREAELFGNGRSIVLYDLTNTHFEGLCTGNPKAARGRNKQKRHDCLQVTVGIAFDAFGNALAHEVFEGNISDSATLFEMLGRLDDHIEGEKKSLVILDAGIATRENIALLRKEGYSYLVNVTRGSRVKYAEAFAGGGFSSLTGRDEDERIEVKSVEDSDNPGGRLVLCRSMKRAEKESGMFSKAEERFFKDAAALQKRVSEGRLKDAGKTQKSIGRLLQKHPRVARYYEVEYEGGEISVTPKTEKREQACELHGCYVLKTDQDFEAEIIWNAYMLLLKAEDGFKMLKGTLGLRPNFHHKEERVDGHIFITVLAYHLLSWIRSGLERAGDKRTWRTVRRILRTHVIATTRFPLEDGRIVSVRKPSCPDQSQIQVYRALGIDWTKAYTSRKSEQNRTTL